MTAPLLAASPSWYWYATRGLGTATLIVLTCTVVLGIVTATRWTGETTPGFVAAVLHRNLSLLAAFLLAAHVVTTVLDPFANISLRDSIIPVGAAYRPVWLGLGVASMWIVAGVTASSLLRDRVGPRLWRLIHWAVYAAWPLAVIHGLGTGSDARAPWLIAVVASCVMAVLLAVVVRLRQGEPATASIRAAATIAVVFLVVMAGAWALGGPLQQGWAAKAGTPIVKAVAANVEPVHLGPGGFRDPLAGVLVRDSTGNVQISMRDMVDTALTIAIRSPNSNETLPVVTVARGSRVLCTVPATADTTLYAVCGTTRLTIAFSGPTTLLKGDGNITGWLTTSGPLN